MGSALSQSMGPPPPPTMSGAPGGGGSALAAAMPAGVPAGGPIGGLGSGAAPAALAGGAPGPQMPPGGLPPPPTHAQTVAALRHFQTIQKGIAKLLKNPDCGKSDIRSEAQDMLVNLVAKGISTAGDAVKSMTIFPDMPFEQKKFLENQFAQSVQAANAVLDHHRMAYAGQSAPPDGAYDQDQHGMHMSALTTNYKGMKRA